MKKAASAAFFVSVACVTTCPNRHGKTGKGKAATPVPALAPAAHLAIRQKHHDKRAKTSPCTRHSPATMQVKPMQVIETSEG